MTDWHRMEWQFKANVWAGRIACLFVVMLAPEVIYAFKHHWPLWEEIALPIQGIGIMVCMFVRKYTDMYRIDL